MHSYHGYLVGYSGGIYLANLEIRQGVLNKLLEDTNMKEDKKNQGSAAAGCKKDSLGAKLKFNIPKNGSKTDT